MLLLFGKDVGFMLVTEMIVDHAPNRGIPGAGYKCYGFYGMLSVEYIVVSIAAAHFSPD